MPEFADLPPAFVQNVLGAFGDAGRAWLAQLPTTLATYAERWQLSVQPHFANLSYNYVAPVLRADGSAAVLKLGVPHDGIVCEGAALRCYAGEACAQLLEADLPGGALLLERLHPGLLLATIGDDTRMTEILAETMQLLWREPPPDHCFPSLAHWTRDLERTQQAYADGSLPFSPRLLEQAIQLRNELLDSSTTPILLHGDLHHENVLSATRRPWLAIDPKGVVGDPAYEVGALFYNQIPPNVDLRRMLAHRLDVVDERLPLDRQRLHGWAIVQAVLSACWSLGEQDDGWRHAIACAEVLAQLR